MYTLYVRCLHRLCLLLTTGALTMPQRTWDQILGTNNAVLHFSGFWNLPFLQIVAEKQLACDFWHGKQRKPRAETYQTFTDLNMPTEGFSCYWFTVFSSHFLTSAKAHIIDSCEWKFLLCWNYYPWSQSARNAHDLESYQCYHLRKMSTHLTATCHKNKQTLNRWVQGLGDPSSSNPLLFR